MGILDILFSFDGKMSRKEYIIFFVIFTFVFSFIIIIETALGGILYFCVIDKMMGNIHYLFFPALLLFLCLLVVITAAFITYIAQSFKRAKDFSKTPVQYIIYYTSLIGLITLFGLMGNIAETYKTLIVSYILFFAPYLFFKTENRD